MNSRQEVEVIEAVIAGDVSLLRKLLENGADPNIHSTLSKVNGSGLHFAAVDGKLEIAKLLLEYGASVDEEDDDGNTPLGMAVFNYRGDGSMVELLIKHGADVNHKNHFGKTPYELAHMIANYDVRKYFA